MFSQDELDYLRSISAQGQSSPQQAAPAAETEPQGLLSRAGQHLVNLPSNIGNAFLNDIMGLADIVNRDNFYADKRNPIPQITNVKPAETTGHAVVDFMGEGLAPELASYLLGYGAVGKIAKGAGIARSVGLETAKQAIAGGFQGASDGGGEAAFGAASGLVGGMLEKFSRIKRLLPAAASATLEGVLLDQTTDIGTKGAALQSAVDFIGNMLPGRYKADIPQLDAAFRQEPRARMTTDLNGAERWIGDPTPSVGRPDISAEEQAMIQREVNAGDYENLKLQMEQQEFMSQILGFDPRKANPDAIYQEPRVRLQPLQEGGRDFGENPAYAQLREFLGENPRPEVVLQPGDVEGARMLRSKGEILQDFLGNTKRPSVRTDLGQPDWYKQSQVWEGPEGESTDIDFSKRTELFRKRDISRAKGSFDPRVSERVEEQLPTPTEHPEFVFEKRPSRSATVVSSPRSEPAQPIGEIEALKADAARISKDREGLKGKEKASATRMINSITSRINQLEEKAAKEVTPAQVVQDMTAKKQTVKAPASVSPQEILDRLSPKRPEVKLSKIDAESLNDVVFPSAKKILERQNLEAELRLAEGVQHAIDTGKRKVTPQQRIDLDNLINTKRAELVTLSTPVEKPATRSIAEAFARAEKPKSSIDKARENFAASATDMTAAELDEAGFPTYEKWVEIQDDFMGSTDQSLYNKLKAEAKKHGFKVQGESPGPKAEAPVKPERLGDRLLPADDEMADASTKLGELQRKQTDLREQFKYAEGVQKNLLLQQINKLSDEIDEAKASARNVERKAASVENIPVGKAISEEVADEIEDEILVDAMEGILDRMEAAGKTVAKQNAKLESIAKSRGFKLKGKNRDEKILSLAKHMTGVGGNVSTETLTALSGATLSGLTGYAESDGDIGVALGAAAGGAMLGLAGSRAIRNLRKSVGKAVKAPSQAAQTQILSQRQAEESIVAKWERLWKETSADLAYRSVAGRGGVIAQTHNVAENMLGLNMPWLVKKAQMLSGGLIGDITEKLNVVLDSTKHLSPDQGFVRQASRYMRGSLIPLEQSRQILRKGNAIEANDLRKLSKEEQAKFEKVYSEKWIIRKNADDTNTSGEDIEVWYMTPKTQREISEANREALRRAAGDSTTNLEWMEMPLQARQAINQMQSLIVGALPEDSKAAKKILGTMDQYQSRTFKIHTDKSYYPEEGDIVARMSEIKDKLVNAKLRHLAADGQTSDIEVEGWTKIDEDTWLSPKAQAELDLYSNESFLRREVEEEILEHKRHALSSSHPGHGKSSDIDTNILQSRKELTTVQRRLMGEHVDVVDETVHTFNKLASSAEAGAFIRELTGQTLETGLKASYQNPEDYIKALNVLQDRINLSVDPVEKGELIARMNNLKSYRRIDKETRYGLMEGSYVDRHVYHNLKEFRSPLGWLENPIGQGFAKFNTFVKKSKTVWNPITHVRNIVTVPMFMAMGQASSPTAIKTAAEIIANKSHPLRSQLRQLGVLDATMAKNEFQVNTKELLSGDYDSKLLAKIKQLGDKAADIYNAPDAFVRVAAYLSAQERAAKRLKLDINDPAVIDDAMKFVERRTMDYKNVPDAVKIGRQLPFMNMFISYAHEIGRISKNMALDAAKGDWRAAGVLGTLVAAPFAIQAGAEAQLSPEELAEWNLANKLAPDYSRSRFKIPVGKDKNGSWKYFDITAIVPHDSYLQLARSIGKGDFKGAVAVNPWVGWDNTPALSIVSEQITGRDNRTRREFRGAWDRLDAVIEEVMPPETPGFGYEWDKGVQAWSRNDQGGRGLTNFKTGRTETIGGWLTKHFTGVNVSSTNLPILLQNAEARAKRAIANEKAYLNDVMKSNATPQVKERAMQQFKEAAMIHAEEYRQLIQRTI